MSERDLTPLSVAALLLLVVVWGLSIPVTKLGLLSLPPLTLTAMRYAFAVPPLLVLALGERRPSRQALPRIAALGVLGIGVGQVTQTFGVQGTTASIGTIISATIPVFMTVFAALRLRQPVTIRQFAGLVAAFGGIALIAFRGGHRSGAVQPSSVAGIIWLLISSLAIAFYYVWSFELACRFGTVSVAAWSTLFGFIALLPWAGFEVWRAPIRISVDGLGAAAFLGILVTAAGLFLWLHLLQSVPARIAASVQYLQPFIGIVAATLMFGDKLGSLFALGAILILGGLSVVVVPARRLRHATSRALTE